MKKKIILIFISLFVFKFLSVSAQDSKFQVLIVYNFTKLLDWPDKTGDFTIKVIGNIEFAKELNSYTVDKKAGGKQNFNIQKVDMGNIHNCQILFVGSSESGNLEHIINTIENSPTLIVTEKPDMTKKGAGVSFVKADGAWKFQYKEENIKKHGIKVSLDFKELGISK